MLRAAWDTNTPLLLVLRRTRYPNPAGCLQRLSDSYYHSTTARASPKSRQPQTPTSISTNQAREACWQAPPPWGSQLQSHLVSDPEHEDQITSERQPSSQIELRLRHSIWSGVLFGICRKWSLKRAQQRSWQSIAMPRESGFFFLRHQGHLQDWSKVLRKRARFPNTIYPLKLCLPNRAEVTQLAAEPGTHSAISWWPRGECARVHSRLISHWETCSSGYNWLHQFLGTGFPSMQRE